MHTLLVRRAAAVVVCLAVAACAGSASAQAPVVGARADGMGGAFVAVADDASATYWNPAGLINGPLAHALFHTGSARIPSDAKGRPTEDGGSRNSSTFLAFALPSIGLSYLHTVTENVTTPTAASAGSRDIDRPGESVSRLTTDRFGVTVVQSLTGHLVVGATVKLLRGSFAQAPATAATASEALEQAASLRANGSTRLDADVAALAWVGSLRAGLVGRNLARPDFTSGASGARGRLARQVRAGIAVTPGFSPRAAASRPTLTFSVDADLTRSGVAGDERRAAAGVERWFGGRLALRGGANASTVGDRRLVVTGGATVALGSRLFVDAVVGRGETSHGAGRRWGVGGRAAF